MKLVLFQLGLLGWLTVCASMLSQPAIAQVTSDGTLSTRITSPDNRNFTIEDGDRAGGNLFHSFRDFSVPTGGSAYFNNATDVQNIFSRVTGGQVSNIDGLIHANAAANVFLLNPNGIIFGPHAVLDVGGAFIATTGDRLQFSDGSFFSAVDRSTAPLLTVSVPIGIQFGSNPGDITLQRTPTSTFFHPGRGFVLAGNHLQLNSGHLIVPGGRIELASIAGAGTVGLILRDNRVQLNVPSIIPRSNISLSNGSIVSVGAPNGGDIAIHAQDLTLLENSAIVAGVTEGDSLNNRAGNITIDTTGTVRLNAGSIVNLVQAQSMGNGGDIDLNARSLFLRHGGVLGTFVIGQGQGGNLNLRVRQNINIHGFGRDGTSSLISSELLPSAIGQAGDINITTGSLTARHGGGVVSGSFGQGDAGDLNIQVRDRILVVGSAPRVGFVGPLANSYISSGVEPGGVGIGGTLDIQAGSLILRDGGFVSATTRGRGNGGDIHLQIKNRTILDGIGRSDLPSFISTGIEPQANGHGGNLRLATGTLAIRNGAFLSATTRGDGNTGNIQIQSAHGITLSGAGRDGVGSFISVSVEESAIGHAGSLTIGTDRLDISHGSVITTRTRAEGNGGNLAIHAQSIHIENGGQISATSSGGGRSGNISIRASEDLTLSGQDSTYAHRVATSTGGFLNIPVMTNSANSGIYANTTRQSNGEGGSLHIMANQLTLRDTAEINANSQGSGRTGNINVNANSIQLQQASLQAQSRGGDRGSISIDTNQLLLRDNSQITTNATGTASGGNITLHGNFIIGLNNSDIVARAQQGQGGNIHLSAQSVLGISPHATLTPDSDINASSQIGLSGSISINNPAIKPDSGLVELPTNVVDASQQIAQVCASTQANRFIVTGRGGLPEDPTQVLRGDSVWNDLRDPLSHLNFSSNDAADRAALPDPSPPLREATGLTISSQGIIELVASGSVPLGYSAPATCSPASIESSEPLPI